MPTLIRKQVQANAGNVAFAPLAGEPPALQHKQNNDSQSILMNVNADAHEEYERRHRPIWTELETVLKNHGVSNYSIFLEPKTNQLFGYVEIESEELWARIADTDECKRWWKFMKDVMPTNADDSPVSVELKEVFHLD